MAVPSTKEEFKQYCLRKLGSPVIEINVDDDQVDDRIDEAMRYYWDYHYDGSFHSYYSHQITETDRSNKYVTLPETIIGVNKVFSIADPSIRSDDMFNIRYQIALNDLYNLTSVSVVPYYMAMQHLGVLSEILVGKTPIRYNRHMNRVWVDMEWTLVSAGEYLLFEVYESLDSTTYADIWSDRWFQNYVTAKIKYQWGSNLTKFVGMQLPGGVQFNGEQILAEAKEEIRIMEEEMINSFSIPVTDMYG